MCMCGKKVLRSKMVRVGPSSRMASASAGAAQEAEIFRNANIYVGFFHSMILDDVQIVPANTYLFQMSSVLETCAGGRDYDRLIYDTFAPKSRERLLAYLEGRQEDPILANMILYGPGDEYFNRALTFGEGPEDATTVFGIFLAEDKPETEIGITKKKVFRTNQLLSNLGMFLKPTAEKPLIFALIGCAGYEIPPLNSNIVNQLKTVQRGNTLLEKYLQSQINTEFLDDVVGLEEAQSKKQRRTYETTENERAPSTHAFGPERFIDPQAFVRKQNGKLIENTNLPSVENIWLQMPIPRRSAPQGYGLLYPDGAGALHAVEVDGKIVFRRVQIPDAITRAGLNTRFVQVTDPQHGAMPYSEWKKIHSSVVGTKRKKTRKRRS